MKITYDQTDDVLHILLTEQPIETVTNSGSDLTLDFDKQGSLVALEMRNSGRYLAMPGFVELAVQHAGADQEIVGALDASGRNYKAPR